ncbi:MAG TPA: hypothetical protein VGU66_05620 [Candidatus Elarobacter sp.]|nr:hypothetical protein [Candidatus Elarobacter sp.]
MKALFRSAAVLAVVALAACGGGGGGGGSSVTPPQQTIANTSSPFYLPSKAGNRWVFSTNGSITDAGRYTTNCGGCVIQGQPTEGMDIFDTTGVYSTTFFFAKTGSGLTGGTIDTLIGTSTNHGTNVNLVSDGAGHYGIPVNDSAAFAGENWSNGGGTSTITAVNGTQAYGASGIIQSINTDHLTGPGLDVQFGFARGVGFTSLTASGQTATLTSFSIDAANSLSVGRSTDSRTSVATGTTTPAAALSLLRALF